jgi:hypothetical protein
MAQRRIAQEGFGFASVHGRHSLLDELDNLIGWHPIATALGEIHAAAKGEPAWPPLALFKAMLIAVWYDLSKSPFENGLARVSGCLCFPECAGCGPRNIVHGRRRLSAAAIRRI